MTNYKKYVQKIFEEVANIYDIPQDIFFKRSTKINDFYKMEEQMLKSGEFLSLMQSVGLITHPQKIILTKKEKENG